MQISPANATIATMKRSPQCLYITNLKRTGEHHLRKVAHEACAAGVDGILLREPDMNSGKLLALASALRVITHQHHAQLIIHSQADIARAIEADGVHLSAANIREAAAMRRWLGAVPMTLSTSCHNAAELRHSVDAGVDFALLSPLFATASHPEAKLLGVTKFQQLTTPCPIEVIALGGITTHNRAQLAGHPIAAMRAIDEAEDITRAVALLVSQQTAMAQQ